MFFGAGEPGALAVTCGYDGIGVVYADFCTGIDAILTFPELDQPGSAAVIKVDRKRIEDHLETGRHIVIEPRVSGLLLPGVYCGGEDAAVTVETIAEGIYQFLYKGTFGTAVHSLNLTDDFLPAAMKKDTAKKGHE